MCTLFLVGLVFELVLSPSHGTPESHNDAIGKIVGGVPVDIDKFPHSVQLFNMIYNTRSVCCGSILNSYTVLSAAHCFVKNQDPSLIHVIAGARFFRDENGLSYKAQLLVIHERFNRTRFLECDIALVFLRNAVRFSKVIQKAVIVNTGEWMNEKETNFYVAGWGRTEFEGHLSDSLLMAQMRYVDQKNCGRSGPKQLTQDMFCLHGNGKQDTCNGDSGAGVMWNGMIVGIVSHGRRCSTTLPAVFSNVWFLRNWIKKQIYDFGDNFCRSKNLKRHRRIATENDDLK